MSTTVSPSVREAFAIDAYRIPTVTAYNRLEGSPRTANFSRSIKAEVRDALWMLTRQWQFGEFQAEDAGSPVTSQIVGEHTTLDTLEFPSGQGVVLDPQVPLETRVERERLQGNLFLAIQMARYFLRLARDVGLSATHRDRLLAKYPLAYPIDQNDVDGAQLIVAVGSEMFDGFKLHNEIVTSVAGVSLFQSWMEAEGISATDQARMLAVAGQFESWVARTYSQPAGDESAWLPSQLEYQFAIGMGARGRRLVADQYFQGHLDWYNFDVDAGITANTSRATGSSSVENLVSFIPGPVGFKGMPNPRFWMLEDGQTDFGALDSSATGLLHLLFAEFGLIYGNDWFMLPYPMDVNTLCEIRGMTVTDVFGQHTLVRPAGRKGDADKWERWTMFEHTALGTGARSSLYYLPPSITKSLEGDPLEAVSFLRDEMANLAWAVEGTVPSQAGKGVSGNEMAVRDEPAPAFLSVNDTVQVRYVAGTSVADNWIPFIPVRKDGSSRETRFQRARMPASKGALGVLLNEKAAPYYVNEEEIPRAGIAVRRSFQRTRWLDGRTYLWIGRVKEAGEGEGSSNLRFDQIVDIRENLK